MNNRLFFILAGVCLLTHAVRSAYEILKHRNKIKPDRISFVIVFTNMAILWISWFVLCGLDPCKINVPGFVRFTGLALAVAGLFSFLTALFTIKTLESYDGDLITTGIYRKIWHPMYLGFILWCIGFPIFQGALFSIFLAFLFISNILFWRHLEESELVKRFPDYARYRIKTLF